MGCSASRDGEAVGTCPVHNTGAQANQKESTGESSQKDNTQARATLFHKLGGTTAVIGAVDIFYGKIMADAELVPFFKGIDMTRQKRKQFNFLSYAFGGSKQYEGQTLRASHKRLIEEQGLNEHHFDLVAGHLVETLKDLKVAQNLIDEVLAIVGPTKAMIFQDESQSA